MIHTTVYHVQINIVQDTLEAIATKKQFAKRQAFAALNTELRDNATYIIRTSAEWVPTPIRADFEEAIIVPGDGVYTYRITAVAWVDVPNVDWSIKQ